MVLMKQQHVLPGVASSTQASVVYAVQEVEYGSTCSHLLLPHYGMQMHQLLPPGLLSML